MVEKGMIEVHGSPDAPHLVISRPEKANTLTVPLLEELAMTLENSVAAGAGAIVLRGAGGRFCGGADLDEFSTGATVSQFDDALARVTELIASAPVAIVAAVQRYAYGAGVDLAWSCDVVVVGEDVKIAIPATALGILYNPDALRRLHARVGSRALRQLLVAGREMSGTEVADVVVAPEAVVTTAAQIATESRAGVAEAVQATKAVLNDFDLGRFDPDSWEALRGELVATTDRMAVVRRVRERG